MHEHAHSFGNNLLIALPSLQDSDFARSVTLICQHDGDGAMGVVVNRPSEYTLGEVLQQMGISSDSESISATILGVRLRCSNSAAIRRRRPCSLVGSTSGSDAASAIVTKVAGGHNCWESSTAACRVPLIS